MSSAIAVDKPGAIETLEGLATAINREHEACELSYQASLDHALKCGQYLIEAKDRVRRELGHGHWGQWLSSKTGVSDRTSQVYMQVARDLPQLEAEGAKPQSIKQALMLLNQKEETPLVEAELVVEPMPAPKVKPGAVEIGRAATVQAPEHPLHGKRVDVVDQRGQCYVARHQGHDYPLLPNELIPADEPTPQPERPKPLTLKEAIALLERSYQEASRHFSPKLRQDIEAALNL